MPRVPTYDNYQVTPNIAPTNQFQGVSHTPVGTQASEQALRMGEQLTRAGLQFRQMEKEANQLRVNDATNLLKEYELRRTYGEGEGFTRIKGFDALSRQGGKALADEYGEHMQSEIDRISQTLGNAEQRALFGELARKVRTDFVGRIMSHEANEYKNYSLSVADGIQATAMRDISLNWADPVATEQAIARLQAETYRQAQLLGKSAEWQHARVRELTSGAHKLAALSALNSGNLDYANAYLNKYANQMEANDLLAVRQKIDTGIDHHASLEAVDFAFNLSQINPGDFDKIWNGLLHQESGGRQLDSKGNPITSHKGAIGIAQVMPNTARYVAQKYGIKFDENRYKTDSAYNELLGKLYFKEQLRDFGGDITKALAAYNTGPDNVKKAMAKAAAKRNPGNWLKYTHPETQKYVPAILARIRKAQAKTAEQTMPSINDIIEQAYISADVTNNPGRKALVDNFVEKKYKDLQQEYKQMHESQMMAAYKILEENGGDFAALTPEQLSLIPVGQRDKIISYAKAINQGRTESEPMAYMQLTKDDYLLSLSDAEFYGLRTELTNSDWQYFAKRRTSVKAEKGSTGKSPDDINNSTLQRVLNNRLVQLGLNTSSSHNNDDLMQVATITRNVTESLMKAQQQAGKQFTEKEIAEHVDQLLMMSFVEERSYLNPKRWFGSSTVTSPVLLMEYGDIPSKARDFIEEQFEQKGMAYTEQDVLNAYWNMVREQKGKEE